MSVERLEQKLGIKASDTATIRFDDCRVPAANLLGSADIDTSQGTVLATARVWKGQSPSVDLGIKDDLYITLPRGAPNIATVTDVQPRLIAPIAMAADLGTLRVVAGNQVLETKPLHPLKAVPSGGWWRRLIDTIRLWFVK